MGSGGFLEGGLGLEEVEKEVGIRSVFLRIGVSREEIKCISCKL